MEQLPEQLGESSGEDSLWEETGEPSQLLDCGEGSGPSDGDTSSTDVYTTDEEAETDSTEEGFGQGWDPPSSTSGESEGESGGEQDLLHQGTKTLSRSHHTCCFCLTLVSSRSSRFSLRGGHSSLTVLGKFLEGMGEREGDGSQESWTSCEEDGHRRPSGWDPCWEDGPGAGTGRQHTQGISPIYALHGETSSAVTDERGEGERETPTYQCSPEGLAEPGSPGPRQVRLTRGPTYLVS